MKDAIFRNNKASSYVRQDVAYRVIGALQLSVRDCNRRLTLTQITDHGTPIQFHPTIFYDFIYNIGNSFQHIQKLHLGTNFQYTFISTVLVCTYR